MAKNNRPVIDNPLAGMGLDDFVRDEVTKTQPTPAKEESEAAVKKPAKPRKGQKLFDENLAQLQRPKLFSANFGRLFAVGA